MQDQGLAGDVEQHFPGQADRIVPCRNYCNNILSGIFSVMLHGILAYQKILRVPNLRAAFITRGSCALLRLCVRYSVFWAIVWLHGARATDTLRHSYNDPMIQ
jgi:hypothetical protein